MRQQVLVRELGHRCSFEDSASRCRVGGPASVERRREWPGSQGRRAHRGDPRRADRASRARGARQVGPGRQLAGRPGEEPASGPSAHLVVRQAHGALGRGTDLGGQTLLVVVPDHGDVLRNPKTRLRQVRESRRAPSGRCRTGSRWGGALPLPNRLQVEVEAGVDLERRPNRSGYLLAVVQARRRSARRGSREVVPASPMSPAGPRRGRPSRCDRRRGPSAPARPASGHLVRKDARDRIASGEAVQQHGGHARGLLGQGDPACARRRDHDRVDLPALKVRAALPGATAATCWC